MECLPDLRWTPGVVHFTKSSGGGHQNTYNWNMPKQCSRFIKLDWVTHTYFLSFLLMYFSCEYFVFSLKEVLFSTTVPTTSWDEECWSQEGAWPHLPSWMCSKLENVTLLERLCWAIIHDISVVQSALLCSNTTTTNCMIHIHTQPFIVTSSNCSHQQWMVHSC